MSNGAGGAGSEAARSVASREHVEEAHALLAARATAQRTAHSEDPTRPDTVNAMQIALLMPKDGSARRTDLLEAAARAAVAVCLDDRAVTDEAWRAGLAGWYDHLIRKIARRARGAAWERVQTVPGVTVRVRSAQARAFVPGPVAAVPQEVKRLQIKGTEAPVDALCQAQPEAGVPLLALNSDLHMTAGKSAAQAGHGSMLLAAAQPKEWVRAWAEADFPLQVRELSSAQLRQLAARSDAVVVRDAGYTEVVPDSVTVVAVPAA